MVGYSTVGISGKTFSGMLRRTGKGERKVDVRREAVDRQGTNVFRREK